MQNLQGRCSGTVVSLPTDPVNGDLDLPETNTAGDTVTWKSGNTEIISDDGKLVSQPEKDTEVIMTASIGDQEKEFIVTVAGLNSIPSGSGRRSDN